jgi:hypothetical protein
MYSTGGLSPPFPVCNVENMRNMHILCVPTNYSEGPMHNLTGLCTIFHNKRVLMFTYTYTVVTTLTRTSKCLVLDGSNPYGILLVLSPNHGRDVSYKWERRNAISSVWELIQVPVYTCLLFVDDPGDYRCTVCEEIYYFIVLWKGMMLSS